MDASPGHSNAELSEHERELELEVRELERRVSNLERRAGIAVPVPAAAAAPVRGALPDLPVFAEAVPILGRALLGISGAYLLRALTELGALPRAAGVAAGIVYAVVWLWLAARLPKERGVAIVVNGLTSVAILAPLLWEATIRFHTLSSGAAAVVVAGFSLAGQALCWRKNLAALCGIATASAALTGTVLMIATHDLAPFTLALLAIAGGVEIAVCRDRAPGSRWFIAGIADIAVVIFAVLIGRGEGLPEGYAPAPLWLRLAAEALLPIVYGASAAHSTLFRRRIFTGALATQAALALAIGLGSAFQSVRADGAATAAVAVLALSLSAACYAIAFVFFGRERKLNLRVYATFAFLLGLAGSYPLASGAVLAAIWAAWALGCCWTGLKISQPLLGLHGAILLLAAAVVSGAEVQPAARLFGVGNTPVSLVTSGIVAIAALLSYVAVARISPDRVAALLISGNLAWIASGMAASGLTAAWQGLAGGQSKSVPNATLGTAALMLTSLVMAWSGEKLQRRELIWLVYTFMAIGGAKLLALDLHLDNTLPLVVSLLLYGGTLTGLPRILRKGNLVKP